MDIIINSLYSKREIFVRELISNAADALDKLRYLALTEPQLLGEGDESKLEIKISFDRDAKTLTFRDTGIGMTKAELIKNLGVVARSGTSEFVEAAAKGTDAISLIGQFGVGFYSVYLAADKVTVVSKQHSDKQYIWESTAEKSFTVAEDPRGPTLGRGTEVTLHMKEDAMEFLNEQEIRKLVERYSEFINYPIYLLTTKEVSKEVPKTETTEETEKKDDELNVSEESEAEKPATETVREKVSEWSRLNEVKAIWTRPPSEITEQEYKDFYKSLAKDESEPLEHIHFTAEGEITFRAILYIPKKAPPSLYDKFYEKSTALKLYVRRVLISDEFDDFLPRYLNFIKGVVDSEDLPLNVSRETLAQSKVLKVMGKKLTRKVLEMLKKLADSQKKGDEKKEGEEADAEADSDAEADKKSSDSDAYDQFWSQYGKSIKLGCIDDRANKAKLAKLLRFVTSKSEGKSISLEEYVERMQPKQKYIYYITGESIAAVKNSPFLERLLGKGIEVVYMVDPLDEYLVQSLTEFEGTQLKSITKEGALSDDEKDKLAKYKEEYKELIDWLKGVYGDKVEKVVVSNRITKTPMVITTGQYGWSANMERIMNAQTFANAQEATWLHSKKTLEINPFHPIIKELKVRSAAEADDKSVRDLATLLYDAALVQSGFQVKEVNDFASRIHRVVASGLSVDPNAEAEVPAEEEDEAESSDSSESAAAEDVQHEEL